MGTFTQKTDYLLETKGLLKYRINSLGGSITSGTTFRDYLVWLDSLYEALEEKTITGLPDSLEGKCEQTGTPTPTSPQPINITTGRQVVSVSDGTTTNDYEINLGKNIFDGINKETFISAAANQCNIYPGNVGGYIRVNGGKYTISTTTTQTKYRVGCVNTIPGTSLAPCYNGVNKDNTTSTITIDTTGYQYLIVYATDLNAIQVEKGIVATTFSEYKTPIYLGKIGNYKDYIFKNTTENPLYDSNLEEGQWYIHKEIGRVVLNGGDTTFSGISGTRNTGYSRFYVSVSNPLRQPSNVVGKVMCNRLIAGSLDDTYLGNEVITSWDSGDRLYLYINDIATYNLNNANTWLQTHNIVIYYALATPTNTLIEDEELINQLNEIEIFTVISEDFYN